MKGGGQVRFTLFELMLAVTGVSLLLATIRIWPELVFVVVVLCITGSIGRLIANRPLGWIAGASLGIAFAFAGPIGVLTGATIGGILARRGGG